MNSKSEQLNDILFPLREASSIRELLKNGMIMKQAQNLASDYYAANNASPQIMAAGISQIQNEKLRICLVVNLYEECGSGNLENSHVSMFKEFMTATGINPAEVENPVPDSPADNLIKTFLSVCQNGPAHRALAILHGFEDLFAYLCGLVGEALDQSQILPKESYRFFPIHSIADIAHAERMREAMLAAADTEEKWQECLFQVEIGAKLQYKLFENALGV